MQIFDDIDDSFWERVFSLDFVNAPQCWTTCGNGRCCSNNISEFNFQLLPMGGTTLIYMEKEYDYLASKGGVPENVQWFSFDFGGSHPFKFAQAQCRLGGLCDNIYIKPLICRIFPFIPEMSQDGSVVGLLPGSIFDLTAKILGFSLPCGVESQHDKILSSWKTDQLIKDVFSHPYILKHLLLIKEFSLLYRERLLSNHKLKQVDRSQFWRHWEIQYLSGALVDSERMKKTMQRLLGTKEPQGDS